MPESPRPGDGWSDTSWSQESHRRDAGTNSRSPGDAIDAGEDGWGHPSYSGDDDRHHGPANGPGSTQRLPGGDALSALAPSAARRGGTATRDRGDDRSHGPDGEGWTKAGPLSGRDQRVARAASRRAELDAQRTQRSMDKLHAKTSSGRATAASSDRSATARPGSGQPGGGWDRVAQPATPERGVSWWLALLVLVAITVLGAIIDALASISGQDGFNYGIVVASIVAVLLVRRSHLFPVVIAPPIVYSVVALATLYIKRSNTSGSSSGLLIDAVQNYLVYGFPALAAATAAALIIAGIRLISRK